jgi:penicillin-binding protein 2
MHKEQSVFKNFVITRRQFLLGSFKLGLFGLIAARLGFLQLINHDKYSLLSKQNSISTIAISPLRGEILDRNGNKLALNQQRFRLILSRSLSKKSKLTLEKVFKILDLDQEEQARVYAKIQQKPVKSAIIDNLSWRQIILIEQNIFDLANLYIDKYFSRLYPFSHSLSHPIGYIASTSSRDNVELGINEVESFSIGKTGVEKYYNANLVGSFGYKSLEVDAHGNQLRELDFKASCQGQDLVLNIDCSLQHKICNMFGDLIGSAVVYDLKKQEVIALVSLPNFQSGSFAEGLSQKYWKELNDSAKLPLLNKTIQATYPPGSIFKLITCLAALNAGFDANSRITCKSGAFLGNHFHCWNKDGHGPLNMEEAIGASCNYYMYHIVKMIGHKAIIEMAKILGLSQKVGIDLPD